MCGIFGVASAGGSAIDRDRVKDASMLMKHRGPDAFGQWGLPGKIELAHLRLAIIDLSPAANQPFRSSCGRYVIVFNGEIYNYIEMREELASAGHTFRTASDTEVLLASYIEWGTSCVTRFNGDWAFAIYDQKDDVLFCSRDRFGVKPFNYAVVGHQFVFSSEIKSILHYRPELRHSDYNIIANYCRNSLGAQHEQTWFSGVKRLLPAHNLLWRSGAVTIERYWQYPATTTAVPEGEAVSTYRTLFTNAVRLRMRSDVPVGTTLSSGIDSGSVVSTLRTFYNGEHRTFTAVADSTDFEGQEKCQYRGDVKIDERERVARLATDLHLDAHFVGGDKSTFVADLERVIDHLESGHSSPAIIPLEQVLRVARNHVGVVLDGQGADELLGGYVVNQFPVLLYELLVRGHVQQAWRELAAFREAYSLVYAAKLFVRLLNLAWTERLYYWATGMGRVFGPKLRRYVRLSEHATRPPPFSQRYNRALWRSHTGGLVNLLHYGDALSLANSVESRLPFMDVNLVEYAFRLPFHLKARNGLGKYIHRSAMKGTVPEYVLSQPIKFGFNTPLSMHFAAADSPANQVLLSDRCLARGTFDPEGLRKAIDAHVSRKRDNSPLLFRLLSVELWFRQFIDEATKPLPEWLPEDSPASRRSGAPPAAGAIAALGFGIVTTVGPWVALTRSSGAPRPCDTLSRG